MIENSIFFTKNGALQGLLGKDKEKRQVHGKTTQYQWRLLPIERKKQEKSIISGIAKENVDFGAELYPVVGMQSPHEKIDANFGQVPFVYDIHEQIEVNPKKNNKKYYLFQKTKNFVRKQIEAIELPVLEKHDWCHK